MGVYGETENEWYTYKYPDFQITGSARELAYHAPTGEREESALSRCEYYLRRLHILHCVLIFILWAVTVNYRIVTSVSCRSAFAMLEILTAAEILGMIFEFMTVQRKVAKTVILEETELPSKRGILFFKLYGAYFAVAVQETAGVIFEDVRLYKEEYEKASCEDTLYIFRAGLRYVGIVEREHG